FYERNLDSRLNGAKEKQDGDHLLRNGLPGQPASGVNFRQFAGEINVDHVAGRALFYYFVESASNSSTKPLILWLNGGPGCSSLGMGALSEIGPFGVNPDGETLYARQFAWNRAANVLFLESPVGVGFSYSNTTSDYNTEDDRRTAEDAYIFLVKWFDMYERFKGREFYLIGESYAGYYIPELADVILKKVNDTKDSTPVINLTGIMIGNGLINDISDTRGLVDYAFSHALIADDTHEEVHRECSAGVINKSDSCRGAFMNFLLEIGSINYLNLYSPQCQPSLMNHPPTGHSDPCDLLYVQKYLNLPQVQVALNANKTQLHYPWAPCSDVIPGRVNMPKSMFPVYKRLMGHGLHILLYSGDVDVCVPVTSTRYSLAAMGLKVIEPWHTWTISGTSEVAGYKTVYDGLTYYTVIGAGHQVPLSRPDKSYALLNSLLGGLVEANHGIRTENENVHKGN
uniref:serine carboxypeptidase II-3-like n=1 Tax=Erigeron canadensis TaxID=72917 RepID=UPI001CB97424